MATLEWFGISCGGISAIFYNIVGTIACIQLWHAYGFGHGRIFRLGIPSGGLKMTLLLGILKLLAAVKNQYLF